MRFVYRILFVLTLFVGQAWAFKMPSEADYNSLNIRQNSLMTLTPNAFSRVAAISHLNISSVGLAQINARAFSNISPSEVVELEDYRTHNSWFLSVLRLFFSY